MQETAAALPAKGFFIHMITRDITLEQCVLDLLDNSIDAARQSPTDREDENLLAGFWIKLTMTPDAFSISDNCGGISVDNAKHYAFRFGRPRDAPARADAIGTYGIGMKRAIFKIGRLVEIRSSTTDESFSLDLNVEQWELNDEWKFPIETTGPDDQPGTTITVRSLNDIARSDLSDPAFVRRIVAQVSRGYSLFLQQGLQVEVNGEAVSPEFFSLLVGGDFEAAKIRYQDDDVSVEIIAGLAERPISDDSADAKIPHYRLYGWYVICNDRVVLAGDKTDRTVWGHEGFNAWHNQYNGFLGIAHFRAHDPAMLPWTTTKRDVDLANLVYRRAVSKMKRVMKPYFEYTNVRKDQEARAKELERVTKRTRLEQIPERAQMRVPVIEEAPKRIQMRNVSYRMPEDRLQKAGEALGNRNYTWRDIGIRTFEYFYEREVGEQ